MTEKGRKMESVVLYHGFVMPPIIEDLMKRFSSGMMVNKDSELEVKDDCGDKKFGPTTIISTKVEKNSPKRDANPLLSLFALEIDQQGPRNQADVTSVGFGKLTEELSTATTQMQPEENRLAVLDKNVNSLPSLDEEEKENLSTDEGLAALDKNVSLSSSSDKKKQKLDISYKEQHGQSFSATLESKDNRLQGKNVEFPRPVLSPPRFLLSCLIVFLMVDISVVQGSCAQSKKNISNLHLLGINESCRTHNVNLQCGKDLQLCLPVVPGSDLAVGCNEDRYINGKGCPEWNNDNGCYLLNVRYNECETCSDHYLLSNSSEVAKCFKDKRATTTEQITVTSAKGTPDKGTSLDHGDETTAASPNKTSKKSEGNNEPGGVIVLALVLSVGAASVFIFAVIKVRNRRRNPAPEPSHELGGPAPVDQPLVGSAPVDQQQSVEPAPEQQHLVGPAPVEQQQLVGPASEQQPSVGSVPVDQQQLVGPAPEQQQLEGPAPEQQLLVRPAPVQSS